MRSRIWPLVAALAVASGAQAQSDPASPAADREAPAAGPEPDTAPAEKVERAGKHFSRGLRLYAEGEYPLALIEFERAYELIPDYRVKYNIAQVSIQNARYARALEALRTYLDEGKDEIPEDRRREVEADIEMLKERTANVRVTSNAVGAEVLVDDLVVGHIPLEQPVLVDAGVHRIQVRHAGFEPKTRRVTLAGADSVDLEFALDAIEDPVVVVQETPKSGADLAAPPIASPPPAAEEPLPLTTVGWMTTGSLAIGAATAGALGLAAKGELDQLKRSTDSTPAERQVAAERARNRFLAADILTAAAVLAGGATLYLTLSGDSGAEAAASSKPPHGIRAGFGPHQVWIKGRF